MSYLKIKTALENCGVMKEMMGTSKSCKTSIKGLASGDKFLSNTKEIVSLFVRR